MNKMGNLGLVFSESKRNISDRRGETWHAEFQGQKVQINEKSQSQDDEEGLGTFMWRDLA